MTRDDVIRMAREAGFSEWENTDSPEFLEVIERFATLAFAAGAAAEREACAKVVESSPSYDWHRFACEAAAAIRARGNT